MYNTFYIFVTVTVRNTGATNLLCDYRVTKDDDWVIIEFQGDIEHNQVLYRNFIEDIKKKNPTAYIIVKQPSGKIDIESPVNMLLSGRLSNCMMEAIEQKFKEIEQHIK